MINLSLNKMVLFLLIIYRFLVDKFIGSGSFSKVYRSFDIYLNKYVAIKIYHQQYHYIGENESQILSTIQKKDTHCHIITLYQSFYFGSHCCLVLELMDFTLYDFIKNNNSNSKLLNFDQLRIIAFQVLLALNSLQKINIIHADIKPENIMLKTSKSFYEGQVYSTKICDLLYGSNSDWNFTVDVKLADFSNSFFEFEKYNYLGDYDLQSLPYRSPEILYGIEFSFPIDMWSFGCVLVESFIGTFLFKEGVVSFEGEERGRELTKKELSKQMFLLLGPPPQIFKKSKFYNELFFESEIPLQPR
eukprot:TRINITY_DN2575_c1_g1_i6.p1 TRINITY_DN2575_c1_g1~~TRINITY_DN2575_c1_g1_i6.p1  ORF type:complete len:303 (-),score=19.04 TRINITY_DN2575_c1_g1_i6:1102-2010(-)